MKHTVFGLMCVAVSVGCASNDQDGVAAGAAPAAAVGDAAPEATSVAPEPGPGSQSEVGVLTAGAWDDNAHVERFIPFAEANTTPGLLPTPDEFAAQVERARERSPRVHLDVALVIDATGSMSDELAYLQREFSAAAAAIQIRFPEASVRLALVVYRDDGDAFVTQSVDFAVGVESFQQSLAQYHAAGGGDYPEAVTAAFADARHLSWRTAADVARIVFWVADAPHHEGNTQALRGHVASLIQSDVHVYPVASSGIDLNTEANMRVIAQQTLGRYLFLTDDSGVGNGHLEPKVPCYYVTSLIDAVSRSIDAEMTASSIVPQTFVRAVGNPVEGVCTLDDGSEVSAF